MFKTQPELAAAAENDPNRFHELIRELDEQRRSAESARLREIVRFVKDSRALFCSFNTFDDVHFVRNEKS